MFSELWVLSLHYCSLFPKAIGYFFQLLNCFLPQRCLDRITRWKICKGFKEQLRKFQKPVRKLSIIPTQSLAGAAIPSRFIYRTKIKGGFCSAATMAQRTVSRMHNAISSDTEQKQQGQTGNSFLFILVPSFIQHSPPLISSWRNVWPLYWFF